jgi:hypothetical protein
MVKDMEKEKDMVKGKEKEQKVKGKVVRDKERAIHAQNTLVMVLESLNAVVTMKLLDITPMIAIIIFLLDL